jgi:hypothetical protein
VTIAAFDDSHAGVRSFLTEFRLREAARAAEFVARCPPPAMSSERLGWWAALAAVARTYRVAISDAARDIEVAISKWAEASAASYFAAETERLSLEFEYWLDVVPGGRAYVAWLSAYVATAELDGHAAGVGLRRWSMIASDFLDVADVVRAPSLYEQMQGAADALERFLPLPQHPLRDMRRFAFLPETFPD